jgi:hypothetical protein
VNKPVLISAATILATAFVAAVLWPDGPGKVGGIIEFPLAVVTEKPSAPPASDESSGQQRTPEAPIRNSARDLQALIKRVEEGQQQYAENARASLLKSLKQRYTELGKALDLTSDEMTRMPETLAEFQLHPELLPEDLRRHFLNGTQILAIPDPAMEQLRGSLVMTQSQEAELRNILGDKYDNWLAFGLAPEIRTDVMRFQDVFGPDANPLSDEQTESVVAALAAEQVRINRDMSNIPRRRGSEPQSSLQDELDRTLRYSGENNRRLVMAASPYLNAGQLIDYSTMLQQDLDKSVEALRTQLENPRLAINGSDRGILRPRP